MSWNPSALFMKYRSTYTSALYDVTRHSLYTGITFYSIWLLHDSWWSIFPTILLGLLTVKTFIIYHDCGHHSYTPSSFLNTVLGICSGICIATPLSWSIRHDTHHATNGMRTNKYDWRYNEHIYYTVKEYQALPKWKQYMMYMLITPELFYLWAPFFNFFILERFSVIKLFYRSTRVIIESRSNIILLVLDQISHNIIFGLYLYYLHQYHILYQWLVSLWIASTIGVLLFHNQHTFHPAYVVSQSEWTVHDNGIKGSSFIQIPYLLKYYTGGIEYHHIHHINSKIPGYHLEQYHNEVVRTSTIFDNLITLSLRQCYDNLWLVLYDEEKQCYVGLDKT
jgi:omega-6 fatty acid desaturase (delta-12 desaturase)